MLKKLCAALEECIVLSIKKSSKIDEKSSPKVRQTLFARKIDKQSLPGAPFGAKDRFLVDFGDPQGSQKQPKGWSSLTFCRLWEPPSGHLGPSIVFFSILPPFLVNFGSILDYPGANFINFGNVFCCVCVCVSLVFGTYSILLGCWVVVLLGSWVLGFLGCWVALFLGCWFVGFW